MSSPLKAHIFDDLAELNISFIDASLPEYDQARVLFNGRFDPKPLLIAYPQNAIEVVEIIHAAQAQGVVFTVRGAGHDVMGVGSCDDGIVIDLRRMNAVSVDAANRTATAQAGATVGEFIQSIREHNMVATFGSHATVGLAGYTLGGGIGILMSRYGLLSDNVVSAEIVTADGTIRHISETDQADLFWAIRGGGGNFGLVTSFTYRVHPIEPTLAGLIMYPASFATEGLYFYRDFTRKLPDSLSVFAMFLSAPNGTPIFAFFVCYTGPLDEGTRLLGPLRDLGSPIMDTIAPMCPADIPAFTADRDPAGNHYAFDSRALSELSDEAISAIVRYGNERSSTDSTVVIYEIHGAAIRRDPKYSAVALRDVPYAIGMYAGWPSGDETSHLAWLESFKKAIEPIDSGPGPITLTAVDNTLVGTAYRHQYKRLQEIKMKYDPQNVFCHNRNIKPTT